MNRRWVIVLGTMLLVAIVAADAGACPNCKDSLAQNGSGLVQGYFWSILFMLAMPFTIFASLSAYFYLLVRRARQAAAAEAELRAGNPFAADPGTDSLAVATEALVEQEVGS